ncbi:MAG: hypothetical protein ACYDDA_12355 [Acidiferrobacteraceae bacterium]
MKKRQIENATLSGIGVSGLDVARMSRNGRVMHLRHSWPQSTDGRILDGVRRAWLTMAQRQANHLRRSVEVYTHDGSMLAQVQPEERAS